MTSTVLLASSLAASPSFADNLQYQLTGLLVVLFTLGAMAVVVTVVGKVFILRDRRAAQAASAVAPRPAEKEATSSEIPGPVLAAIAAAVTTVLEQQRHRIHGIRAVDPRGNMAWGAEGRRSIYASKNLR